MHAKQAKRPERGPPKRSLSRSKFLAFALHIVPTREDSEEAPRLPKFAPVKLNKFLLEKTGKTAQAGVSGVTEDLFEHVATQQVELLQALGLDVEQPDYAQAFLELAKIHHGMGVIMVETARGSNKNAKKWSKEQDDDLLKAVITRRQRGMTIASALNEMVNDEAIWQKFPPIKDSRSDKPPALLRAQNYRRRLVFIKRRNEIEAAQSEIIDRLAEIKARQQKLANTDQKPVRPKS
ncbi:hypothetical protein [Tardiphaga sp. vice278]|uniref:hypothetical protein n=1 Tax=Tardiphaga sp. vice278 TaxID=2592815 RepID=UPI001163CBA3|nr:hypothetical protein [Tardiphaga sp. vice278]QDM18200.1 hypothetical protein FNL53_21425 [Tardiphaga sp. vice278]